MSSTSNAEFVTYITRRQIFYKESLSKGSELYSPFLLSFNFRTAADRKGITIVVISVQNYQNASIQAVNKYRLALSLVVNL